MEHNCQESKKILLLSRKTNSAGKRYQHCGVVLADGSVVVTGGQDGETGRGNAIDSVERFFFVYFFCICGEVPSPRFHFTF